MEKLVNEDKIINRLLYGNRAEKGTTIEFMRYFPLEMAD